ncbi:Hypothetical protein R9X50_00453600 [Acrodontium crateriforme]|uniref:Uncharacterized protein n=1 Tax=Acrodontium crateriforme TaxID=150365 RepID=A0AAQ3M4U4_9PEZI|nr:Hypothetical protein R9X50_00453600 [Acrodontium crateriforme]
MPPSIPPLIFFLSALATFTSADFFLSNTTVCMGAFPIDNCYAGVIVLSGTDYNKTYTCNDLWHAQDNAYITQGTAGPFGSWELESSHGVCGSRNLHFNMDFVDIASREANQGNTKYHPGKWRGEKEFESSGFTYQQ